MPVTPAPTEVHTENPRNTLTNLGQFIGQTPLYPLHRFSPNRNVQLFAKMEWMQAGGSVKSRPAFEILRHAMDQGYLDEDRRLLDATSGNTGIAYASLAASCGIRVTLCIPENASRERKSMLNAMGVELIETPQSEETEGARQKARELSSQYPGHYYYADQYSNDCNWKAHFHNTASEILRQTNGNVTHFVCGIGTGGTFTGTGKRLRETLPHIRLSGLQPETALHGLEGWKHLESAGAPQIYDEKLANELREVSTENALHWVQVAAREEGLLLSPSSAANLCGAIEVAKELKNGVVVTVFPDDASKYSSIYANLFT